MRWEDSARRESGAAVSLQVQPHDCRWAGQSNSHFGNLPSGDGSHFTVTVKGDAIVAEPAPAGLPADGRLEVA